MSKYQKQLKDPRWQRRRLEIMSRDGWKCTRCRNGRKELHVHHIEYKGGLKPWEYSDDQLKTLCKDCHELEHRMKDSQEAQIKRVIAAAYRVFDMVQCGEEIVIPHENINWMGDAEESTEYGPFDILKYLRTDDNGMWRCLTPLDDEVEVLPRTSALLKIPAGLSQASKCDWIIAARDTELMKCNHQPTVEPLSSHASALPIGKRAWEPD